MPLPRRDQGDQAPADWLSRQQIADALGCARTTACALLRPHEALARPRGQATCYPPSVLESIRVGLPDAGMPQPDEVRVQVVATRMRARPREVEQALHALRITPVTRRVVGLQLGAYINDEQAERLSRQLRAQRGELGLEELARLTRARLEEADRAHREALADLRRGGWMTLEMIAGRLGCSIDAAADRMWPHYRQAQLVPAGRGEPRQLWYPPEVLLP